MKTSDIFNLRPSTAKSIQTRESQTFQHQNIFQQDDQHQDKTNKTNLNNINHANHYTPLEENNNHQINAQHKTEISKINSPQPSIEQDDVSKNRKFKSWQSNIFNEPTKENFNQKIERTGKNISDRINIGAVNVNWWNTKDYPQIQQSEESMPQTSPYKLIEEHNRKIAQEVITTTPEIKQQEIRKNNKNYSDIFDSGLARYYDLPPNHQSLNTVSVPQSVVENNQQHSSQQNHKQVTQHQDQKQEIQNQHAKKQMLRGMSSVFDTHDYYNKMIQETVPTTQTQQPQTEQTIQQALMVPQKPQFKYIKFIVRGLLQKFDKNKFRQFCEEQDFHVAQITSGQDNKKRQNLQFILKSPINNSKDLINVEKYLISQSGRIVTKEQITEQDYLTLQKPIQETIAAVNVKISQNKPTDKFAQVQQKQRPQSAKQDFQKRAQSAQQTNRKKN